MGRTGGSRHSGTPLARRVLQDRGKDAAADGEAGGDGENGGDGEDGALFALHDVNISAGAGELVCVVGRVGSGKTSLARPSALLTGRAAGSLERSWWRCRRLL